MRSGSLLHQRNDEADAGRLIRDGAVQGFMEGTMGHMIGTTASRAKITEKASMMPHYRGPKHQSGEGAKEASSSPMILGATCPISSVLAFGRLMLLRTGLRADRRGWSGECSIHHSCLCPSITGRQVRIRAPSDIVPCHRSR